ncbi:O-phosphoseryl-tRNA(Sec) selenium transferase-like isoform X1 [Homarus americanus]|uniref:O-phosphoseryl-tRNA(Sec) selenium transferase-like isoform X1 n=1 Tax=Homarus americanus TaxID=6706 RepID=UPI001C497723|nr:O-phosphoseryl-tRNA(Sec) selenium transferase-like isoform X1 [Homarus americanus]
MVRGRLKRKILGITDHRPQGTMNETSMKLAERLVPSTYLKQAADSRVIREKLIRMLVEQRKCPQDGWDDDTIELMVKDLALMDSNKFLHNSGVGEREARIFSELVSRRHYGLCHGIGRSGDIAEVQPKAAGSSLLNKLTNAMTLDIIRTLGVRKAAACLVVPLATGMSMVLCLLTLRQQRPSAKYVIWQRIDQKSCFKSIITAGLVPVVVENILEGDELRTNVAEIKRQIDVLGPDAVVAVMTTTSCFAPRGIDKLEQVAALCAEFKVPHLVNNAYGLQSYKCLHHIESAASLWRIDAFVQSTDKNFMVPVGGAIIVGFNAKFIEEVGQMYPGRASNSPIVDLFITLLSMGVKGYKQLLRERKMLKEMLAEQMSSVAEKHGLRVLTTKNNPISIAMTVPSHGTSSLTELGSMMFLRGISGARVINTKAVKTIAGVKFTGWGSHCESYPHHYLTAAASIGMTNKDLKLFITRLDNCLKTFRAAESLPSPQTIGAAESLPSPQSVGAAESLPSPQTVGAAESLPSPQTVGAAESLPSPQTVGAAESVPSPQTVGAAESLPSPQTVGAAESLPSPPKVEDCGHRSEDTGDDMEVMSYDDDDDYDDNIM